MGHLLQYFFLFLKLYAGFFQNSIRYVCIDFRSVPLNPLNLYTLQNANFKSSDVTTVPFAEASFPWVIMASMTSSFTFHNGLSNILFSNSSRSEEHTSELQSRPHLVCRLLLEKKKNVIEMAATETITSIILIKLIRVSLGTVIHPRRFKIIVICIQITLKKMISDFIGIRVNRAKKSGMVNITSSVNSRERSGINTILHELNPLFTINVTMRDIKSNYFFNDAATTEIYTLSLHDALPI